MTDPTLPGNTQDNPYAAPEHPPEVQRKVYSLAQVLYGTFIAGVFVTAFMARNNHLAFNQPGRANLTFWTLFGIGVLLGASGFLLPTTSFLVDIAIAILTTLAAGIWYHYSMRRSFQEHLRAKGVQASHWQAAWLIVMRLIALVAVIALLFALCEVAGIELPE